MKNTVKVLKFLAVLVCMYMLDRHIPGGNILCFIIMSTALWNLVNKNK